MSRKNPNAQPKQEEPKVQPASADKTTDVKTGETKTDEGNPNAQPKQEEPATGGLTLGDGSNTIMTIGERTDGHNLVIGTASVVTSIDSAELHTGLIKVLINYPSDWSKPKFFTDGDVKLCSQETADSFVSMGIGTIQTD